MIGANKHGPWAWVVDRYVRAKVRRAFRGVWVRGELPDPRAGKLVYANHSNFWDGFIAHVMCVSAGWDGYALMEEVNLRRYPFLRRLGAFSIRPGEGRSSLESLRYAKRLMRRERAAVFVFPEGALVGGGPAPGELRRGVEVLGRLAGAACVPVAIRYAFFEHELPDVLLEVGAAHPAEPLEGFTQRLSEVMARVHGARSLEGFTPMWRGRAGVAERWDAVRGVGAT